jgi:hypothetical protein
MAMFLNDIGCSYQWHNLLLNYLNSNTLESLFIQVEQIGLEGERRESVLITNPILKLLQLRLSFFQSLNEDLEQ